MQKNTGLILKLLINIPNPILFLATYANIVLWSRTAYGCNLTRFHKVSRVGSVVFAWKTSKEIPGYSMKWY